MRGGKLLPVYLLLAGLMSALLIFATWGRGFVNMSGITPIAKSSVLALWAKSDWSAVASACDTALGVTPLDPFYLGMRGLANFYEAMAQPDGEARTRLIDESVVSIRKSLATREGPISGKIPRAELDYVLAKAYFHKGSMWLDLSTSYMETALMAGYSAPDSYEYLAMAYASLGVIEKSLNAFKIAMKTNKGPLLKVAAANEFLVAKQGQEAEQLLSEAVGISSDVVARDKARLLLIQKYFAESRWNEAEMQVTSLLAEDPDSAEAHYRLGLLYQVRGDAVHARAEWRKAVSLDPMHSAARQKLTERL